MTVPLPVAPLAAYLFLLFWSAVPFAPAEPVLLAGGAFAGTGGLVLPLAILAAATGSLASDLAKYALGRAAGPAVLRRIARRPAGARAVAWIESRLAVSGPMVIAPSYFVPFGVVASTIACGALRMRLRSVVLGSAVGALIWATVFVGLGHLGATVTGNPWFGFALAVPAALVVGLLVRRRVAPARTGEADPCVCGPTPLSREPERHEEACPLAT
ncbi:VTT domain-containing protein [Pseudonocardia kujensis]|uniref:DedA family protein n=1 Tax=Pseudonocardia kujensis TaxID=1128675 RepID=UPI001E5D6B8A|nr:VTT domain-containing protein [Pseudonocardia kujensis]MCE0761635.1 VTT domain-containing protein [Pseudonocardia kujensis]